MMETTQNCERGDGVKRWIILTMIVLAVAAATMAWIYLPIPSPQQDVVSAAELGLLLLDGDDGISVLGVLDKSLAEQAGIEPGDVLMRINETSLTTVEMLDSLLMNGGGDTFVLELQRGKNVFSVEISLASIVY